MSRRTDALRRLGRPSRGVRRNEGRRGSPSSDRARMLFYEPNPGLRTDLIRAGVLKLRLPTAEAVAVPTGATSRSSTVSRGSVSTRRIKRMLTPGTRRSRTPHSFVFRTSTTS